MSGEETELRRRLEALERRLEQLEARLEAVDASFVRHQDQNEASVDALTRSVDRTAQELDNHLGDHWRSGR